jgi:hypothetical protein
MQRIEREIGTIIPVDNTTQYLDFPKIEFLSEVWLDFQITNTVAVATAVLKPEGPYGYVKNISLVLNGYLSLGTVSPFSLSGHMCYQLDRIDRPDYLDNSTLVLTAGANVWIFHIRVPVTVSDANLAGIIWTGNPRASLRLQVTFGTSADTVTGAGGSTSTFTAMTCKVRTVTFQMAQGEGLDIFSLHGVTTQTQGVAATGVQTVTLPPGNLYLRVWHAMRNTSILQNALVQQGQLEVQNYADPITYADESRWLNLQRWRYLTDLAVGTYVYDLFWTRTLRDAIDTSGINLITSKLTWPAATAVAATADIQTGIEQYLRIPRPSGGKT